MNLTLEFLQWGLLLLVGAATAVNALVLYNMHNYLKELREYARGKS